MSSSSGQTQRAAWLVLGALWLAFAWPDPAPLEVPVQPAGEGVAWLLWGGRLDPNRAPAEALRALPGIGEARAEAIVAARPHCRLDDLLRVRGIGPVTWSRIRDSLELRGRPMSCPAGAASAGEPGADGWGLDG